MQLVSSFRFLIKREGLDKFLMKEHWLVSVAQENIVLETSRKLT